MRPMMTLNVESLLARWRVRRICASLFAFIAFKKASTEERVPVEEEDTMGHMGGRFPE